jgi:hypothetical protein
MQLRGRSAGITILKGGDLEQLAPISNIGGNLPSFETFLSGIQKSGIQRLFCRENLAGKGLNFEKVDDVCRENGHGVTKVNWDAVMIRLRLFRASG